MRKMTLFSLALSGLLLPILNGTVLADPVQWMGNGHWYELVDHAGISWTQANALADGSEFNGMAGHLVTITSEEENSFVFSTLDVGDRALWLGGYQGATDDPEADWYWVTGEAWSFTNWADGEPNDWNGTVENALAFAFFEGTGTWNDAPMDHTGYDSGMGGGYIVEYDVLPVPEPATVLLFGTGLVGLFSLRSRKIRGS